MNEEELRDLLHGAAGRGGTALLDHDAAVDAVLVTAAAQRRRRTALVVAAACIAIVAAVLPSVWQSGRTVPDVDVARSRAAVLDWPVRGSLADDTAALDEVRQLAWTTPGTASASDGRQVAFLGDVEGSRRALVLGFTDAGDQVAGQWFSGPVGADPGSLVADGPAQRFDDAASAAHLAAPGDVLVVLVAPGDRVELSPRVEVSTEGTVSRDFAPMTTEGGVAVGRVQRPGVEGSPGVYRVLRDGAVVESRPVPVSFASEYVWDPPVLAPLDPDSAPPVPEAVDLAVGEVLAQVGLPREQVRLDLLHAGPVPESGTGEPVDAAVVAVTLPNGAVVVSVAWADIGPSGAGSAGSCGMQAHPAGTPVDRLAVAAGCRIYDGRAGDRSVLVSYATPAFDEVTVGAGTLRATGPGVEPLELAVIDAVPDQIVDRAGRGWED